MPPISVYLTGSDCIMMSNESIPNCDNLMLRGMVLSDLPKFNSLVFFLLLSLSKSDCILH